VPITHEPTPHPPPAGAVRVRVFGSYLTAPWSNGFWLHATGVPTNADLLSLASQIYEQWDDHLIGLTSSSNSVTECRVEWFSGVGTKAASYFETTAGGDEAEVIAASAALVLSWQIADSYRGGKPRNYICGFSQAALGGTQTWSDGLVTAYVAAAAAFLAGVNAITAGGITAVQMGTYHFFKAGVALDPPVFDIYNAVGVQKRVCTQRRRLGREIE
jgi:hypothetical protein